LRSVGLIGAAKTILRDFLFTKGFTFFEKFGVHVLPVHYYSPVPDTRELHRNLNRWYRQGTFTGVDFNIEEQLKLVDSLRTYSVELNKLPPYEEITKRCFGEGYGPVESHILHAIIRHFKPKTIIEVGAGVSTFFSVNALSINKQEDKIDSKMICIEPYPWPALKEITGDCQIQIIPKSVQEVSLDFFGVLGKGDILFIDSSHTLKIGSDVCYLYLEVLTNLKEGVIIAIDDICFPYLTLAPDPWIFRYHQFWTEAALVQAFLTYNSAFEIILCSSWLHYKAPEVLRLVFSIYNPVRDYPGSLWLQKIR